MLFVHGIGKQAPGMTLSNMGDPLISWMREWSRGHDVGDLTVLTTPEVPGAPLHVNTAWTDRGVTRSLVLAECWWAETFAPPSVRQVLTWAPVMAWKAMFRMAKFFLAPIVAFLAVLYIFTVDDFVGFVLAGLAALVVLLLALPLVLIAVFIVLRILPGARRIANTLATVLTGHAGDAWVLRSSETRFAAMRARCLSDLSWLSDRCDRVVVVAHSQGSIVATETLAAVAEPRCDAFVTVGSAIRLLRLPGHDPVMRIREKRPTMRWLNVFSVLDPVSAGPIATNSVYPVEIVAQNVGSALAAHVTYSTNKEGFQSVVMAALRYVSKLTDEQREQPFPDVRPFTSHQDGEFQIALCLRRDRAFAKLLLRCVTPLVAPGIALLLLFAGWPRSATGLVRSTRVLPDWLASFSLRGLDSDQGPLVFAGVSALAMTMAYQAVVVGSVYRWWDRRATAQLALGKPNGSVTLALTLLALVLFPLLVAAFIGTIADGHNHWWAYLTGGIAVVTVALVWAAVPRKNPAMQFDAASMQFLRQHMNPAFPAFASNIDTAEAFVWQANTRLDAEADALAAHLVDELGVSVRTQGVGMRELRFPGGAVVVLLPATFAGASESEATFVSTLSGGHHNVDAFLLIDLPPQHGDDDVALDTLKYYVLTEPDIGTSRPFLPYHKEVSRNELASVGAGPFRLDELPDALGRVTQPTS